MFVNSLSYLENAVVSSIFAIPLTAYGIFNLNEFILRHNFGLDVIVGIAVPLFLLIIVIVTAVRQWSKIGEDLSNGKVHSINGKVYLGIEWGRVIRYRLTIDYVEFKISEDLRNVLNDGKEYCLYYLPISKTILSAEEL